MAINIDDVEYTDDMYPAKKPFLTDVIKALDTLTSDVNVKVKNNLKQLAKDCFPENIYTFDSDGNANLTNNLFDKFWAVDTDASGDDTISTTGSWLDVDATNKSITFTPELVGDYRACFQFNVEFTSSSTSNDSTVRFRLYEENTGEASDAFKSFKVKTGVSGSVFIYPVTLEHIFENLTATEKKIKLQYHITAGITDTTVKVLASSTHTISMTVEKI